MNDVEYEVLGCMLNDPESPWIIHGDLVAFGVLTDDDARLVVDALETMARRGWITIYFHDDVRASLREYERLRRLGGGAIAVRATNAADHLGPWYEVTEAGEHEWDRADAVRNPA
jgi:hypothetical protein